MYVCLLSSNTADDRPRLLQAQAHSTGFSSRLQPYDCTAKVACPPRCHLSSIILLLLSSFTLYISRRILSLFIDSIPVHLRLWRHPDYPSYGLCYSEPASRPYPYPGTPAVAGPCIQRIANAKTVPWHVATARQMSHRLISEVASPTVPPQLSNRTQHCPRLARTCRRRAKGRSTTNMRPNRGGKTTRTEKRSQWRVRADPHLTTPCSTRSRLNHLKIKQQPPTQRQHLPRSLQIRC